MKKTTLFLLVASLAALCAASAFAQQSTLMERQRIATHRRLFTELGLIDGTLAPADYTGAVAKAATAIQVDVGATNIVLTGYSCAYNATNRTLTLTAD